MARTLLLGLVLVLLLPVSNGAGSVYVDNVVVVLDCSGSMNQRMHGAGNTTRLAAAKAALRELVGHIPDSTHVGLLVFGGQRPGWVYPLGPRRDEVLFAAVDGLTAGGGTPLGEYMKTGADRLLEARQAQYGYGTYRLLVVTDGEASNPPLVEQYTPQILARGIVVDVIGVDMKEAHTLARRAHSYRRADDPASLQRAVQEVFAEVGSAGADDGATAAAFAEIQAIEPGVALAMIEALAVRLDTPIGTAPAAAPTQSSAAPPPAAAPPQPARPPPPAPVPTPVPRRSPRWPLILLFVFLPLLLSAKASREKGRRNPPRRR